MFFKKKEQIKTSNLDKNTLIEPRLYEFVKKMRQLGSSKDYAILLARQLSRLIKAEKN